VQKRAEKRLRRISRIFPFAGAVKVIVRCITHSLFVAEFIISHAKKFVKGIIAHYARLFKGLRVFYKEI
jgi:hypothetical protein